MAVDPEPLACPVCPGTEGPLEPSFVKEETRRVLVEKCREKFRGEEPVVAQGLSSERADPVYPIVPVPAPAEDALPESEAR